MSFSFLNIAMLAGLVSIALPVLAHLLSKRRYDVVQWGAMQFLLLGHKTRRRIRFQDILLLLLRMLLLACLAFALARPYGQGGIFNKIGKSVSRDIVFIIDGSGSTSWKQEQQTPHAAAIQWVHQAVEELNPGDTVSLIDARSRNRRLIHPATSSFPLVRKELDRIPEPTGTSNLTEAVLDAIRILSTTSNSSREVVVLTDGQAYPWKLDDEFGLQRIDDALKQPEITPAVAVVDLSDGKENRANISVGQIELSRQMTVPGFPIRFKTTLQQSGGVAQQVEVSLAVNGQPAPESERVVNLLPNGEAVVEFEHVFPVTGYYRLTLSITEDKLPQDDQSEAIVVVEDGIPILLVDGETQVDETKSETFFLKSAFAASGEESPWVRTEVIQPRELNAERLARCQVVFLCNLNSVTQEQRLALIDFVLQGGGVVFAPGEQAEAASWNRFFIDKENTFLPAELSSINEENPAEEELVTIESLSLEAPWLQQFRKEEGVDFWLSRYSKWWELKPRSVTVDAETPEEAAKSVSRPSVLIKLTNGTPYLVSQRIGDGTVLQFAAPLDADWSTLPARNDFVPFLHEMVFRLADVETQHNVSVGMPIQIPLNEDERPRDYHVTGPGVDAVVPELARNGRKNLASFDDTTIPGVYWYERKNAPQATRIPFVVTDDRAESDLTPLDKLAWETLAANDRVQRIELMSELTNQTQSENSRTELWWLLLLVLLVILISEVALTRKMLLEGHADLE
ncbi:BatA domain-containing protein [bacterium]|jgi:hypothetical protein|nr:BatA domain-containing protein [bacterium]